MTSPTPYIDMKKDTMREFDSKFNIAYVHNKGWAFLKEEVKQFISKNFIDKKIVEEEIDKHHKAEITELMSSDCSKDTKEKIKIGLDIYKRQLLDTLLKDNE